MSIMNLLHLLPVWIVRFVWLKMVQFYPVLSKWRLHHNLVSSTNPHTESMMNDLLATIHQERMALLSHSIDLLHPWPIPHCPKYSSAPDWFHRWCEIKHPILKHLVYFVQLPKSLHNVYCAIQYAIPNRN